MLKGGVNEKVQYLQMGDLTRAYICLGGSHHPKYLASVAQPLRLPLPADHHHHPTIITKINEIDQNSKYRERENAQPYFPRLIGNIFLQNCENLQKYFWRQQELIAASIPTVNLSC